jgi:hypothetical protein
MNLAKSLGLELSIPEVEVFSNKDSTEKAAESLGPFD